MSVVNKTMPRPVTSVYALLAKFNFLRLLESIFVNALTSPHICDVHPLSMHHLRLSALSSICEILCALEFDAIYKLTSSARFADCSFGLSAS